MDSSKVKLNLSSIRFDYRPRHNNLVSSRIDRLVWIDIIGVTDMSAILFLERKDPRETLSYIEKLKIAGLLPKEATGGEYLGNSNTPEDEKTIKFYDRIMRCRPGKILIQIPGEGINLDETPNGETIFVAVDK